MAGNNGTKDLSQGRVSATILKFALPFFLGQLLQQLYNTVDAWVLGRFAGDTALAAATSVGSLTWLIVGFFSGIAVGGGVVIARFFGSGDRDGLRDAVRTDVTFSFLSGIPAVTLGLLLAPWLLNVMSTPEAVYGQSLTYLRIFFTGVFAFVVYNICTSILHALGDSVHPLYYLIASSLTNVALDLLFVAVFKWGVKGAAWATVMSEALSCVLVLIRLTRMKNETGFSWRELGIDRHMLGMILRQGLPTGIQNSVIGIGNMAIQSSINLFDAAFEAGSGLVMAGHGAYSKIEGFVFLPITCMSMSLPTFVSQNLGAGRRDRVLKGARFGILCGMGMAAGVGILVYLLCPYIVGLFTENATAISYGVMHGRTVAPFFCVLAFSHCSAGVLRGLGKSVLPMISMLTFWCAFRVVYVKVMVRLIPRYTTIAGAYPVTWILNSLFLLIAMIVTFRKMGISGENSAKPRENV